MVKKIAEYLFYSNLYVGIPITALIYLTFLSGNIPLNEYFIFVIASTIVLYPLHRLYGAHKAKHPSLLQISAIKNQAFTLLTVLIALVISAYSFFQLPPTLLAWVIPCSIISLAYSLPLIPYKGKWLKLREITGLKVFLISTVVTLTCYVIPTLWYSNQLPTPTCITGISLFLLITAITIPFDIRDIQIDQQFNVHTLPLIIGVKKAKIISGTALVLSCVIVSAYYKTGPFALSWIITSMITLVLLNSDFTHKSRLFYTLAFEGALVQLCAWFMLFQAA